MYGKLDFKKKKIMDFFLKLYKRFIYFFKKRDKVIIRFKQTIDII